MVVYVYRFPDGRCYVGQTERSPEERAGYNACGYKSNEALYQAFTEYGYENVERFDIHVDKQSDADYMEKLLIAAFDPAFNRNSGGKGLSRATNMELKEFQKRTEDHLKELKNPELETERLTKEESYQIRQRQAHIRRLAELVELGLKPGQWYTREYLIEDLKINKNILTAAKKFNTMEKRKNKENGKTEYRLREKELEEI